MKQYVYEGKTLEEALSKAKEELGISESDIFYKSDEKKGIFSSKVTITLYKKEDIVLFIKNFLTDVISHMNEEVKIEVNEREDHFRFSLITEKSSIFIGKGGRTLDSFRIIIKQILVNYGLEDFYFSLDVDGYKKRQNNNLIKMVKELAEDVLNTKQEIVLDPLNSYERRLVHKALDDVEGIYTESIGEGKERRLVIKYKDLESKWKIQL